MTKLPTPKLGPMHPCNTVAISIHVRFGAGDEEGAGEMQSMEAGEIDVAAIHDVDGARISGPR